MTGAKHDLNPPDPLCWGDDPCVCAQLRLARLQGPIKVTGHPPICWCPGCLGNIPHPEARDA